METQRIFWLLGLVMTCSGLLSHRAQPPPSCACDSGREFVALRQGEFMVMRTGSNQAVTLDIYYHGSHIQETLVLQLGEAAKLPIEISENGTCQTILFRANSDIVMIAIDSKGNMASVPPVNTLGKSYIVAASPGGGIKKLFLTALNQPMLVTILGKGLRRLNGENVIPGVPMYRTVELFGNVVLEAELDLDGFVEISNTGFGRLEGGCQGENCSAIYENLRPFTCLGDEVFAPALPFDPSEDELTVVATEDSGIVFRSEEETSALRVQFGRPLRIKPRSPVSIKSQAGIQVIRTLGKGPGNCSFEIPVQDTSQFCQRYKTFTNTNFINIIVLTCKAKSCPEITINGNYLTGITWSEYKGTNFRSGTYTLDAGSSSHTIEHPTERFGLLVLGRLGNKTYSAARICMSGSCPAT